MCRITIGELPFGLKAGSREDENRKELGELLDAPRVNWVNLDPTVGDEIRKKRPVVVLNPGHEKHLRLAVVVPVTAWASP